MARREQSTAVGGESRGPARGTAATRLRILEGAAAAFGRGGFADTRVDDIIAAAGVSRPSFYKFFRNKDEVFDLLHEMHALSLLQSIKSAAVTADDPTDKVERSIEAFLRQMAASGGLARALYSESHRPGSPQATRYQETTAALVAFFVEQSSAILERQIDPLVYTGLVAAAEAIGASLVNGPRMGEAEIARAKDAIVMIMRNTLTDDPAAAPDPQ